MPYILLPLETAADSTVSLQDDPAAVADALRTHATGPIPVFHTPDVEWELEDPCPYCGSHVMGVSQICRETYTSGPSQFHRESLETDYGRLVDVWCQECSELLSADRDRLLGFFDRPRADNERPPDATHYNPWSPPVPRS